MRGSQRSLLTPRQARILSYLELDASISIRALAKKLRLQEHVVHYERERLKELKVMGERILLINPSLIGLQEYVAFISFANLIKDQEIERYLLAHPAVSWLAEAGAEYHYYVCLECTDILAFERFFSDLGAQFGAILLTKQFATLTAFWSFGRRYLSGEGSARTLRSYVIEPHAIALDKKLALTLSALAKYCADSRAEIARRIKVPLNTLQRQIATLERSGIITGYVHPIDTMRLGVHTYKALLSLKDNSPAVQQQVLKLAKNTLEIVTLVRCVGSWDFEIRIELESTASPAQIAKNIVRTLGNNVSSLKVVPLFRFLKALNLAKYSEQAVPVYK